MDRPSEEYKRAIDKIWGPIRVFVPKKNTHFLILTMF